MRSLPPPRVTRKRRWRRIKRAIRSFFSKGYVSDPGAFLPTNNDQSISKIKQSRFSSRVRRARSHPTDLSLRDGATAGLKVASFVGRVARRGSMPLMRRMNSKSSLSLSLKF